MPKKKIKSINDAIILLKKLEKDSKMVIDVNKNDENIKEKNFNIISKSLAGGISSPSDILEVYLKVLISILPLIESKCKEKTNEYSIRALTTLGESIRQTIIDLEIYRDPEEIMNTKIVPHIQFHHDQVIKNVAICTSDFKKELIEFIDKNEENKLNKILIKFLKNIGENLKETYTNTLNNIRQDILTIKGI